MLSIIIINFKQKKFTDACVESLYAVIKSIPFEVILVNNSPEEDFSDLDKRYPNFQIINNENTGFSRANNIGAKHAKYEYLLFLNPDTIFITDPFADLIRALGKRNYGAVGLKLYNRDNTFQLSFGVFNNFRGEIENKAHEDYFRKKNIEKILEIENNYHEIKMVDWVTGAALFMKKKVFDEVRGFDERFFLYYEDADLCRRLQLKKYYNYFYPFSKIIHYKGENVNLNFNSTTYYYSKVSQLLFYKLHNSALNNFALRIYLFVKYFFLSLLTFKKINFKILKLALKGV